MITASDRRGFLRDGTALVLGWCFLESGAMAAQAPASGPGPAVTPEDLLRQAREQTRRDVRPALVILAPEQEAARQRLADELSLLLGGHAADGERRPVRLGPPPPAQRAEGIDLLLIEAVVVCLPARFVRATFAGTSEQAAVVLLDHTGRRLADLQGENLFRRDTVARLTAFLHGEGRLASTIQAQREALGPDLAAEIDAALRDLDADSYRQRQMAAGLLERHGSRITALLVQARRGNGTIESARRLQRLLARMQPVAPVAGEPALPFGLTWERRQHDPCPPCGRGFVPAEAAQMLRFVRFSTESPR